MSATENFAGQVTDSDLDIYNKDAVAELRQYTTDDVNSVLTFAEAIAASGFNQEDILFLGSPYTILKGDEKAQLEKVPFYIRAWRFAIDNDTERPYVVVHTITEDNRMIILTDGSTGIFAQLDKLSRDRLASGHATPFENVLVANGLRYSEYGVTAEGKPAKKGEKIDGKARTYYLA